jgi:hypothetical protein
MRAAAHPGAGGGQLARAKDDAAAVGEVIPWSVWRRFHNNWSLQLVCHVNTLAWHPQGGCAKHSAQP